MSIKLRLILSNIAMITVPIILFFLASFLLMIVFLGDFREMANFLPESHSYHKTKQQDSILFFELKEQSVMNPSELMSKEYLESLKTKLKELDLDLLVRKNNDIYYSSFGLNKVKANELPDFGTETSLRNLEEVGEQTYAIKQHDFYFNDGGEISLFLMRDASPWNKFVRTFFPILLGLCLVILITTNGLLSYFVSRSIIRPINRLKMAAQAIKNGSLDHSISPSRNDEMGQLTQAFEEMRIQLKDSEYIQKQYEENRKELIAHISHDLKTPITSIKGYVEGVRDGIADTPEKKDRYLKTIYTKAVELDQLIDELFLFSKLDLKKVPFEFEKINIREYLTDYLDELRFVLEDHKVEMDVSFEQNGDYQVFIDRDKFRRVLENIINNSLKYMTNEQKELKISLSALGDTVKIDIADNGPGIPKEEIPFIFNQFYRAEKSRNKLTGGSGLGLSIARMIVEEHKGTIQVDNTYLTGAKMTVLLPHNILKEELSV